MEQFGSKYELFEFDRIAILNLLRLKYIEKHYKEIRKDNADYVSDHKVYNWIDGTEFRDGQKLSKAVAERITGADSSYKGKFRTTKLNKLCEILEFSSIEELQRKITEYLIAIKYMPNPIGQYALLSAHTLNINFSNQESIIIKFIGNNEYKVLASTFAKIDDNEIIRLYRLAINKPLWYNPAEQLGLNSGFGIDTTSSGIVVESISFAEFDEKIIFDLQKEFILQDIFKESLNNDLIDLPDKPKIFWYNSAGTDLSPLVFFNEENLHRIQDETIKKFELPELFVFNCLGSEVAELREILKNSNQRTELYSNNEYLIEGFNYKELILNSMVIEDNVNPNYFEQSHLPKFKNNSAVFYFDVEISKITGELKSTHKVLYFEMENINFFQQVICKDIFNVIHHCGTDEGMAWGNSKKSIFEYIYKDHNPLYFVNKGYKPELIIFSGGTANEALKYADNNSGISFENSAVLDVSDSFIDENKGISANYVDYIRYKGNILGTKVLKVLYPESISKKEKLNYYRTPLLKGKTKEQVEKSIGRKLDDSELNKIC